MTTQELRTKIWQEYDYCLRVIDSCQTMAQLGTARQLAFVNTPIRWNKFEKQRPLKERILDAIFGSPIQGLIMLFSRQMQQCWWDKLYSLNEYNH